MTAFKPLIRDDNAAHQIRIGYDRHMRLVVSCTCLQRTADDAYLSPIRDAFEATELWRQHWARALTDVRELPLQLPCIS